MSLNKAFREIGSVKTARSAFDLSCYNLSTHNMGLLYPVLTRFSMPGDKWIVDIESIVRAMPLVYPAYVDIDLNYHCFFVPMRLLDDNFEDFITGGEDGDYTDSLPKLGDNDIRQLKLGQFDNIPDDDLNKRLGLFPYTPGRVLLRDSSGNYIFPRELFPTSLPIRAYYFIWNEYYRDENLQSKVLFKEMNQCVLRTDNSYDVYFKDPTKRPSSFMGLFYVNWQKDYFTSALPFQQRGTAPIIPFSGDIELTDSAASSTNIHLGAISNLIVKHAGTNRFLGTDRNAWASGNVMAFTDYIGTSNAMVVTPKSTNPSNNDKPLDLIIPPAQLAAGLLNDIKANIFNGLSVSDLRLAVQLQKFFERNARGGVRYTEFLNNHFNVSPTDSRLDRPEFIGGCKFPLVVSDVTATASTSVSGNTVDLGSYAGKAISASYNDNVVNYYVEEFGYFMILFFIRPKTLYFQGFNREFQYSTNLEFPFPEFMHLSEQGITNSEIYLASAVGTFNPSGIFGYQGIYDELRYGKNVVSGKMATFDTKSSMFPWHLAQVYDASTIPYLNSSFIECKPRTDIFQVEDINNTNEFIMQHKFKIKCVRPMPIIGEPGLVDHF